MRSTLLKFDIYKKEQLVKARPDQRISITLYDQLADIENRNEISEQILSLFADDRGAYKQTHKNRFDEFDREALNVIRDNMPGETLVVHDAGVSDARTAYEFYHKLVALNKPVEYYASDYSPEVYVIDCGTIKITVNKEEKILEIVFPPFVFNASRHDGRRYIFNNAIRYMVIKYLGPYLLKKNRKKAIKSARTISLFIPQAKALEQEKENFHLLKFVNILEPSIIPRPVNIFRAMNLLNSEYFNEKELYTALVNIFDAMEEGGLFIVGSNKRSGTTVNGGVFRKTAHTFETVWISGNGPFFINTLNSFDRNSLENISAQ
jgi:hypothetical protein